MPSLVNEVGDDRDNIQPGDRVLLIVENDLGFARFLLDAAREKGFKGLVTSLGAAALALAREYKPDAITLDIYLPDIDGWRVLDRLKNDLATRHIPGLRHLDRRRARAGPELGAPRRSSPSRSRADDIARRAARARSTTSSSRDQATCCVVEPDADRRDAILDRSGGEDVAGHRRRRRPRRRCRSLRERRVDCVVVDPNVPDMTLGDAGRASIAPRAGVRRAARDRLRRRRRDRRADDGRWKRLGDACTVRQVHSPERLLDQTALLPAPHRGQAARAASGRLLEDLHQSDKVLAGKKVLIVDDDMRNIFALSTRAGGARHGRSSRPTTAATPSASCRTQPDIDIVLMDIMMPEMDGMRHDARDPQDPAAARTCRSSP